MMYSVTPWKEGLYQPLSSIMSSVNPNSLCKKSLNFDLSIFSPLASASNTPNKPITSSLVTEIAKMKIQLFNRLCITMQLYCYIAMCRNSSLGFHPYTQRLHATSRFYHKSLVIFGIEYSLVSKRLILLYQNNRTQSQLNPSKISPGPCSPLLPELVAFGAP